MTDTTKKAQSWRDVIPVHPAAGLFPMMAPDELKALGEDIKRTGLPIKLCSGPRIVTTGNGARASAR